MNRGTIVAHRNFISNIPSTVKSIKKKG